MKKKLSILLVVLMSISFLAACTPKDNGGSGDGSKDIDIKEIHSAVKEEYGEDYIPSMEIGLDELVERTNINKEIIDEFIAETPMMSTHVDEFIAIKAVEGKGEDVAKALESYKDYLNEKALQYPMNMEKVKASKVVEHGDYIFFLMLGKFDESEDPTPEEALEFAETENKRAEYVIGGFFK